MTTPCIESPREMTLLDDGECLECGRTVALTRSGSLWRHNEGPGLRCPGSGTEPAPAPPPWVTVQPAARYL